MNVAELLLTRQGLLSVPPGTSTSAAEILQALDVKFADLGYALSMTLRRRLATLSLDELTRTQDWVCRVLAEAVGAQHAHEPLFRHFPRDIPRDTFALWIRKFLVYYVQAPDQACLFCGRVGTTHVLYPCLHVVCDHCFDGSNYAACPACERAVDRSSPFFRPFAVRSPSAVEQVAFKRIDLGEGDEVEARRLFASLCSRRQALSPVDQDALNIVVGEYKIGVLDWLPGEIPVKEISASVFGALLRDGDDRRHVLDRARPSILTATDVLRLLAVFSGADASLQGHVVYGGPKPSPRSTTAGQLQVNRKAPAWAPHTIYRFSMAPLSRSLRRDLLGILEDMPVGSLIEDMLRHQSYWVWAGEFLHPFEYATRYPSVALAFAVVRDARPKDDALASLLGEIEAPDALVRSSNGSLTYHTYDWHLESAATRGESAAFTALLSQRPGELARRLDQALRLALTTGQSPDHTVAAYVAATSKFSTPVLATLLGLLPTRSQAAPIRLFWPKGQIAKGVSAPDTRPVLPPEVISPLVKATERELLARFAGKTPLATGIVDEALTSIVAPFNERTASRSAVSLPRGSRLSVPSGRILRLFLHWCEPAGDGRTTDLDLSVAFYNEAWEYVGVCSYYELTCSGRSGQVIALSAGDLRDAPYPAGATEFVDVHQDSAWAQGVRYAVMVVNSYAGLPFSALDRASAGLMERDDDEGLHFDPRTVTLAFDLQGENGVYLPMVVDLETSTLHWLDVYSTGQFKMNNVETSRAAIRKMCPELIAYFGSGVRLSMYALGLLHAAACCQTVFLRRGDGMARYSRAHDEEVASFYQRLHTGKADEGRVTSIGFIDPVFACLYRGDLDLPAESTCYALFRDRQTAVIAASDLLS